MTSSDTPQVSRDSHPTQGHQAVQNMPYVRSPDALNQRILEAAHQRADAAKSARQFWWYAWPFKSALASVAVVVLMSLVVVPSYFSSRPQPAPEPEFYGLEKAVPEPVSEPLARSFIADTAIDPSARLSADDELVLSVRALSDAEGVENQRVEQSDTRFPSADMAVAAEFSSTAATPTQLGTISMFEPQLVDLVEHIPSLLVDVKYASDDNFTGQPVSGYLAAKALLSAPAANALARVQQELVEQGLGLKVFDAYRPQRAVDAFLRWANEPDSAQHKAEFYPNIQKAELFDLGYLFFRSSHSRASTVDVTLVELDTGEELDMGTIFDYFDESSWPASNAVSEPQQANRMRLRHAMQNHGFVPIETEWWHFTLADEPYPNQYFDIPISD